MEPSIDKTIKAADKAEISDAEKTEPSIQKTMNADKAEISDAEKRAKVDALIEACMIAAGKIAGEKTMKKKTKVVKRRMTQQQIDSMLSINLGTKPLPIVSEEHLASLDEALRDRIRDTMAGAAAALHNSRQGMNREKAILLAELKTKGYVEREVHVTDDEATDDEGSGDV